MIDTNDKATQALDLGEQPKRRGRPATGKALSNAERQRAYRERQKEQRNENDNSELFKLIEEAKKQEQYWMERALQAEKKLAQRNAVIEDEQIWFAEFKMKGERKWSTCDDVPLVGAERARRHIVAMAEAEKHGTKWRAKNQVTKVIYEPAKAPK